VLDINSLFKKNDPNRLYALQLKVRPLERKTLMPFTGEFVHAFWLKWMRDYAPEVATFLHDGNQRRFFTCSSLQFPLSAQRMREVERDNIHIPVDPANLYTIRITLLLGELQTLFYDSLLQFTNSGTGQQPFMRLGKSSFLLEEVIMQDDKPNGWIGSTTFAHLVDAVRRVRLRPFFPLTLDFASLTTFSRTLWHDDRRYNYYARFPQPLFIFSYLARRWEELAPPELAGIVQRERIEHFIQNEGVIIDDYQLQPHAVRFVNHPQKGFIGTCTYLLAGQDEPASEELALTIRQQIILLSYLAFYTGVGYKAAMGMGQCRLREERA
jgi:CRISPR-associated endoribonuclease Cas6